MTPIDTIIDKLSPIAQPQVSACRDDFIHALSLGPIASAAVYYEWPNVVALTPKGMRIFMNVMLTHYGGMTMADGFSEFAALIATHQAELGLPTWGAKQDGPVSSDIIRTFKVTDEIEQIEDAWDD